LPRWSSEIVPAKYRHFQKRLDAINATLSELPKPSLDFSALKPKQRDLIEIYYRCLLKVKRNQNFENDKNEISETCKILKDPPLLISKEDIRFWEREHPPHLMNFLSEQQNLYKWIPSPGNLWPSQLTWVAWDELLNLLIKYQYDFNFDDVSTIVALNDWAISDKQKIVHLYLEMITSEETKRKYLAFQNYTGGPPAIRKRLPLWNNESRYRFRNGKVELLEDE
jgi:hypothetical protein